MKKLAALLSFTAALLAGGAALAEPAVAQAAESTPAQEMKVTPELIRVLREKAEQGDTESQVAFGPAHDGILGVSESGAEALKWIRRAAEQGIAGPQHKTESANSVDTRGPDGLIWTLPLGNAFRDLLEELAKRTWKGVGDSASPPRPPDPPDPPSPPDPPNPPSPPTEGGASASPPASSSRARLRPRISPAELRALLAHSSRQLPRELREAIENDDEESVESHIADGLDVNQRYQDGATLLHYAATFHCPEVIAALIKHGAPVNAAMSNGATPLDYAVWAGNQAIVIIIIEHGGIHGAP